ncbi:hypothetical protein [Streptomyces sp. B3I7]|uniref:hypothetical protein n=1 Tax=Streptomyces sp. B3I7 TaxID=3042269 RepID=UPI0027D8080F|nr:hypothetical protein [Streptomyces sp. B3I7]
MATRTPTTPRPGLGAPVQRATPHSAPQAPAVAPAPKPAPAPPPTPRVQRRAALHAVPDEQATPADHRELTDSELDELTHRLIGRVTRLLRTELRMDRERVGRLRDPRS